ncbi:hypothetical protein AGABI2DRAFT_189248 [Agaricus bisporus var. bisporus H97]|uniref:hypothetical protein n=1 Tax=Agaricus bisporus var. bisporus (strain H97 / ATCC MYA-4626 / FGSC 10389) TaxID=936046 RepID=UPI00029F75B1|nr:hypothetical protein AGABI2DRAFT_189248 [Agaricus bisporus var. bisporus H97]EKV50922.1 hypothetical protein AGABI2DRAFT_189248 [Agaricus bisporus var. bisporus H97]
MSVVGNNRQTPWLGELQGRVYDSTYARLEDEIWAYVDYMAPTPEEELVVTRVGEHVRKALRPAFQRHNCSIHTSGSTSTGLRLPLSDIDLVIATAEDVSATDGLLLLAELVRGKVWSERVVEVLDARVPIIKISTKREFGSLKFDVGINNTSGLKNNQWVKNRLRAMPALKPLVLIIRGALSQRGLNDASQHSLSSFAIVCMCVFFIQKNPYGISKSHLANPKGSKSLFAVLHGFLEYYSRGIPFEDSYISLMRGKLVKKPKKGKSRLIHRRCQKNLVIQCPTDFARNVTASLSLENFEKIRLVFGKALEKIRNAGITDRNILGSLVSVDQRFVEHRRRVKELVQTGQLSENLRLEETEEAGPEEEEWSWDVSSSTMVQAASPRSYGARSSYIPPHLRADAGPSYSPPHLRANGARSFYSPPLLRADGVGSSHYAPHIRTGLSQYQSQPTPQNWNIGWDPYVWQANQIHWTGMMERGRDI